MAGYELLSSVITMVPVRSHGMAEVANGGHVTVWLWTVAIFVWLWRAEAQFRGTRASTMVPMSAGPTHMIMLTIHVRGALV